MAFVHRKKGRRIFMMRYQKNGKWHWESSGLEDEHEAQKLADEREVDSGRGVPVGPGIGKLTLKDGYELVAADYTVNDRDSLRCIEYRYRVHLAPYFGATTKMVDIVDADPYMVHRKGEKAANGTINREVDILRRAFRLAARKKLLVFVPHFPRLDEKKAVRKGFLERHQFQAVRRHLPEPLQDLATVAYITGWRVDSELMALEWRHVDFDHLELRLEAGESKNDEPRTFPITTELLEVLRRRRALADQCLGHGFVCPRVFFRLVATKRGGAAKASPKKPEAIVSWRKAWHNACRAAGLPGRLPHDLRRTAVRDGRRLGIDRDVGMKIHGMKTASIYTRYNIVDPEDIADARRKLSGPRPAKSNEG
jgi:integrase